VVNPTEFLIEGGFYSFGRTLMQKNFDIYANEDGRGICVFIGFDLVPYRCRTALANPNDLGCGSLFMAGFIPALVKTNKFPGLGLPGECLYFEYQSAESDSNLSL